IFGPGTSSAFAKWAGVHSRSATAAFDVLRPSLTPVRTPIGDAWVLAEDEAAFPEKPTTVAPARLLPSGDAYYLLYGSDRELLVPETAGRNALWTSRVWPGAVLVEGETVGSCGRE